MGTHTPLRMGTYRASVNQSILLPTKGDLHPIFLGVWALFVRFWKRFYRPLLRRTSTWKFWLTLPRWNNFNAAKQVEFVIRCITQYRRSCKISINGPLFLSFYQNHISITGPLALLGLRPAPSPQKGPQPSIQGRTYRRISLHQAYAHVYSCYYYVVALIIRAWLRHTLLIGGSPPYDPLIYNHSSFNYPPWGLKSER